MNIKINKLKTTAIMFMLILTSITALLQITENVSATPDTIELATFDNVVCVGDSMTYGFENDSVGYTERLNYSFQRYGMDVNVVNSGVKAETLTHYYTNITTRVHNHNPDIVVLYFLNDLRNTWTLAGPPYPTPQTWQQFQNDTNLFVKSIRENNTGVKIYFMTMHPITNYIHGSWKNQTYFNNVINTTEHTTTINLWEYMTRRGNTSWSDVDGTHFNDSGYDVMAKLTFEAIKEDCSFNVVYSDNDVTFDKSVSNRPYYVDDRQLAHWTYTNCTATRNALAFAGGYSSSIGLNHKAWMNAYLENNFTLVYRRSTNAGIVNVSIDGDYLGQIDTYNALTQWQIQTNFNISTYTAGYHNITIETVDKNPLSSNYVFGCDGIYCNRSDGMGIITSNAQTHIADNYKNTVVSFTGTHTKINRLISTNDTEVVSSPEAQSYVRKRIQSIGYYQNANIFLSGDDGNTTIGIWGFGTAICYMATSQYNTGNISIYVDDVYKATHNLNETNAGSHWNYSFTVDLGSMGYHTLNISNGNESQNFYFLGMEYLTYNYLFFTSSDGENWTFRNDTTFTTTNDTLYYRFIFNNDTNLTGLIVSQNYYTLDELIEMELNTNLPQIFSLIFIMIIILLISILLVTILSVASKVKGGGR